MSDNQISFSNNKLLFFESIVEHSFDGCVICNHSGERISAVFANKAFYEITGFTYENIAGKAPFLTYIQEQNSDLYDDLIKELRNGKSVRRELLLFRKDGTPFWADSNFVPIQLDGESTQYHVEIFHEITHRKKKEVELKDALEKAESSTKTKERFLGNMSHEIRTPISGVLGMTQLLQNTGLTKEQKEYVDSIKLSADNLLLIINDILEFNKITTGDFEINEEQFSLTEYLEEAKNSVKQRAKEKNLFLNFTIDKSLPEQVIGDGGRLKQVLVSLLDNAIKFTNKGEIKVHASAIEFAEEKVTVQIKVSDTGIGISEDLVNTIFDSFNKASKVTTHKFGGTGLGLSIAKKLISQMEGTIEVKTKEDIGTTFIIELPFEVHEISTKETTTAHTLKSVEDSLKGRRILVVDDHPINRKIVSGMLGKIDVNISEAECGEDSLKLLESDGLFDLVLMDVHMPGIGGLATTRKMKSSDNPAISNLPIIAITASVLDRDVEECKEAGMDDFIAKPFTYKNLVKKISAALLKSDDHKTTFDSINQIKDEDVIDLTPLKEMTGGDDEVMKEMLEIFLSKTPELFSQLETEFNTGNYSEMSTLAHTMKPTFSYVGIQKGHGLAMKIEEFSVDSGDIKNLEETIKELKEVISVSVGQLRKIYQEL